MPFSRCQLCPWRSLGFVPSSRCQTCLSLATHLSLCCCYASRVPGILHVRVCERFVLCHWHMLLDLLPSGILSLWGQAPRSIALPPTSGISSLWRSTMLLPTLRDLTCSQSMCILSSFLFNFLMAHLCRRQMAHLCLSSRPCMSLPLSESRALAFRHAL